MHLAALFATNTDDVDVGTGAAEEEVSHHASHGVGVYAQPVGTLADCAVEVKPEFNHDA